MKPDEPELPPKPIMPDCCFSGCAICVLDEYTEEMRRWQEQCDAIRARHATGQNPAPPEPPPLR